MKKLLLAALFFPTIVSAQKFGLNVNWLYTNQDKNNIATANISNDNSYGGNIRLFISTSIADAGIGAEMAGYRTSGKIAKSSFGSAFGDWSTASLNTTGYYTSPFIYANIKMHIYRNVRLFTGLSFGRQLLDNRRSYTAAQMTNINNPGEVLTLEINNNNAGTMLGVQAGFMVKLIGSLWLNAEADYRMVSVNTTAGYMTSSLSNSKDYSLYGHTVRYRFNYLPLAAGLRLTF